MRAHPRQGILAIDAILHPDHDVGAGSEREHLVRLHAPRPLRLRDAQPYDDRVSPVDDLEHLEPASLRRKVREAADDLPTGASGRRLSDAILIDTTPHGRGIEEADPRRRLAALEGVIGVPNRRVAP